MNLEHNKVDKISRIQLGSAGSGEVLSVPIMKTMAHIRKIFQAVISPSYHLANTTLEGIRMQQKRKTELSPEKFHYIFSPFIFFPKEV